ncbi:MAG: hypothetical protein D6806_00820, partial [Deltaproteobacteria bacterium]
YVGKVPDQSVTEIKTGYGELAGKLRLRYSDWADGYGELRLRQGWEGGEVVTAYELREAWAELHLGPVDFRAGRQILAWGRADAFAPTDNLTPRDMRIRSPNEDDARTSNLAFRSVLNLLPLRWELVWLPFFAPSYFPRFSLPGPIEFATPAWPDADFEHGTFATRLDFEFAAAGFSLSYLVGYSTFPGIELVSLQMPSPSQPQPSATVRFHAYRWQVAGADFDTTAGGFGIRAEAALRWPEQNDREYTPLPEIVYVVGLDREIGDFSFVLQYLGRYVLDWTELTETAVDAMARDEQPTAEQLAEFLADPEGTARRALQRKTRMVASQTERLQHSVTLRLAWKLLYETLDIELLGFLNASTLEWLVRPKVVYDVADGIKVAAGGEVYGGPDDTLFGTIDEIQSAGFFELIVHF